MTKTTILICCDAGVAGRDLLQRRDLDVRWALTVEEAIACAKEAQPQVVLSREDLAMPFMEGASAVGVKVPCLVLIEADGWMRSDAFFEAGATAMVRSTNRARILEAISEITGLAFALYPRVSYSDVVDVVLHGERRLVQTSDLSASGVSVSGLSGARIGDRVVVGFEMLDPPLAVPGVVARVAEQGRGDVAGISFDAVTTEERARLIALVESELGPDPFVEPVGLTRDLYGTFTLDLLSGNGLDEGAYRMLLEHNEGGLHTRLPTWLERVRNRLTPVERRALAEPRTARYALAAIDLRIRLAQGRVEKENEPITPDDARRVMEFCRALAVEASLASEADLADVASIRASLLREVYASPVASSCAAARNAA